jgi:hypothetical protein
MARQTGPVRARLEYAAIGALLAPLAAVESERARYAGARAWARSRCALIVSTGRLRCATWRDRVPRRAERLHILRATYENWGRTFAEWMHFSSRGRTISSASPPMRIGELEAWRGTIAQPRRLVLTGHFGNWELMILAGTRSTAIGSRSFIARCATRSSTPRYARRATVSEPSHTAQRRRTRGVAHAPAELDCRDAARSRCAVGYAGIPIGIVLVLIHLMGIPEKIFRSPSLIVTFVTASPD